MMIQQPVIVGEFPGGPGINESLLIALVMITVLIGAVYILGPIARAFARRIEGRSIGVAMQDELHSLQERVSDVDTLRERLMELEERVDFTERLLAQPGRDKLLAGRGGE